MKELIKNKHVLVDNNVLSGITKKAEKHGFLNIAREAGTILIINDAIRFEFLGFAQNSSESEKLRNHLATFDSLPVTHADVQGAIDVSQVYTTKLKNAAKQISFVDCLNAAQLMRFEKNLFLITADYRDYPEIVFDRLAVEAYDLGSEIVTLVCLRFNRDRFEGARAQFLATTHASR